MTEPERIKMTWEQFDHCIATLGEQLRPAGYRDLYGIPRGGSLVAVALSHYLGWPLALTITPATIVVDDICDKGHTLRNLHTRTPFARAAVLYCRTILEHPLPNTVSVQAAVWYGGDKWIDFPWERPGAEMRKDGTADA